jgi:hypothetical protein
MRVFIPDDIVMKNALKGKGIEFAWIPPSDSFSDYDDLFAELGVLPLTSVISVSANAENSNLRSDSSAPSFLTDSLKISICWYIRNNSDTKEQYLRLKENGILERLLKTKEC